MASKEIDYGLFWLITERGVIKINPIQFGDYLETLGVFRYYIDNDKNKGFMFIKKSGRFIDEIPLDAIKILVRKDLTYMGEHRVNAHLMDNVKYFESKYLSLIIPKRIKTLKDTKRMCYLYYRNKAVRITKNEIKLVKYKNLDGFIWKRQVIARDIKIKPESDGEYKTFMWRISGEKKAKYYTLKSVIGFLLHSFKHDNKNRVIVFNDQLISDLANGGSGKGIFHKGIGHIKNIEVVDGQTFDAANRFTYENVNFDTQVVFYDDAKKTFKISVLFSIITEGIKVEGKGLKAIFIPFKDSPKITIATNYILKGEGGSHNRRVFEVEMSAHYSEKHTPEDEFGHLLFTDWDRKEWRKFDNYMIRAVQLFLKRGLIESDTINLKERKIIGNTSKDFYYFMDNLDFRDKENFYKTDLKDDFVKEFPDYAHSRFFNSSVFNRWVETYCNHKQLHFSNSRYNGNVNLEIGPYKDGVKPPKKKKIKKIEDGDDVPF